VNLSGRRAHQEGDCNFDLAVVQICREILTDENGNLLEEGDLMFRPRLAETLRTIAFEGGDALYTGSLANILVEDIQSMGGIITAEDMANFE
jgi:gamma-glutamyltranspeptidase